MALRTTDVFDLYTERVGLADCPHCGGIESISQSLVGYFLVENKLVLLDQGFNPEDNARDVLSPLTKSLGESPTLQRVANLEEFKSVFAEKVKSTARQYPLPHLNPVNPQEAVRCWQGLQGEILSAMLVGAHGIVPKFGVHSGSTDGLVDDRARTLEVIYELIVHTIQSWSIGIAALTTTKTLEEVLARLVDSCGAVIFVADRVTEMLNVTWNLITEKDIDPRIRFHFLAVDTSLHSMLGRESPRSVDWAYAYLLMRLQARSAESEEDGDRFQLSAQRISRTITYEGAWNAVSSVVNGILSSPDSQDRRALFERLDAATEDLGHGDILNDVLKGGLYIKTSPSNAESVEAKSSEEHTPKQFAELILSIRGRNSQLSISTLLAAWRLPWFEDAHAVTTLFEFLEPSTEGDIEERASLLAWFGERMKLLGQPVLALAKIGEEQAPWENALSLSSQRCLWTERSNALRLLGKRITALDVAETTLSVTLRDPDATDGNRATAWLNRGILLRELGRFSEAMPCISRAVELTDGRSYMPLQSLGTTLIQMGRSAEAVEALADARRMAGGFELRDTRIGLLVCEIAIRSQLGQQERVAALRKECPDLEEIPDAALVPYSAIIRQPSTEVRRSEEHLQIVASVLTRLSNRVDQQMECRNVREAHNACFSAAMLAQEFECSEAEALWRRDALICLEADLTLEPRTVIEVAITGVQDNPDCFSDMVLAIPQAIAESAGGVSLSIATMALLSPLDDPLGRLTLVALAQGRSASEIQLLAELRRNAHRKAMRTQSHSAIDAFDGVVTAEMIRNVHEPFVVIEWCDVPGKVFGISTLVSPGNVRTEFIENNAETDWVKAADKIVARLDNWHQGRLGQPHEIPHWKLIEDSLKSLLEKVLPAGGHVVFIDHVNMSGLPYHIALAPKWTTSYAADWHAIKIAVAANGSAPPRPRLGLLHSPRSNETSAVRAALQASADRVKEVANANGLALDLAPPGVADSEAFRRLLEGTDLLKVLCHGQISKDERGIVLIIDHMGMAPPGYSFGATLDANRAHCFGWDELEHQKIAPRTIFLGACSGGAVSISGLDERTSFASMLASVGTNAVVAPRWKIDAELALPILDDAISIFVNGAPLVKALAYAVEAAIGRGVPAWQAHAFVIEGAWI